MLTQQPNYESSATQAVRHRTMSQGNMNQANANIITTRFGEISVDTEHALIFPHGLLGIPQRHHYALTDMPLEALASFKLLQSLDDETLSFIVLPAPAENNIVSKKDVEHACKDLKIDFSVCELLFIVSVHRLPGQVRLSVNARAPLFVDRNQQAGAQYVFHNDAYQVQHFITT